MMVNELVDIIKDIAVKSVESQKPVNLMFGTVVSVDPLKIKVSQGQIYTKEFFLSLYPVPTFEVGDKLVLIRMQGGQQFFIMGKGGSL